MWWQSQEKIYSIYFLRYIHQIWVSVPSWYVLSISQDEPVFNLNVTMEPAFITFSHFRSLKALVILALIHPSYCNWICWSFTPPCSTQKASVVETRSHISASNNTTESKVNTLETFMLKVTFFKSFAAFHLHSLNSTLSKVLYIDLWSFWLPLMMFLYVHSYIHIFYNFTSSKLFVMMAMLEHYI